MYILVNNVITVSTNGYTQQKIGYILFVSQSELYVSETKKFRRAKSKTNN